MVNTTVLKLPRGSGETLPLREGTSVVGIDMSMEATGITRWGDDGSMFPVLVSSKLKDVKASPLWIKSTRLHDIARTIIDVVMRSDPKLVIIEARQFVTEKDNSSEQRGFIWWQVVGTLLDNGVPVGFAMPGTVKKWYTNNGNASKELMVSYTVRMWPEMEVLTGDIADATSLASMAAYLVGWDTPWKRSETRTKYLLDKLDLSSVRLP